LNGEKVWNVIQRMTILCDDIFKVVVIVILVIIVVVVVAVVHPFLSFVPSKDGRNVLATPGLLKTSSGWSAHNDSPGP
jgi:hypothetical protein